jgi:3-deoxy-D-manno-octulosonate 8-phosphate phosphatase (KDO 8-P phosphatase)
MQKRLEEKLRKIRLLILDVDGVLTNNGVYVGPDGSEFKRFHIQDGFGIHLLQKAGVKVALLSGRYSESTDYRAKELQIEIVYNGYTDKLKTYKVIRDSLNLKDPQIAFVGDDLPDVPVLKQAGVGMTVKNAQNQAKKAADYVTDLPGGEGAVREIVNLILKAKRIKY